MFLEVAGKGNRGEAGGLTKGGGAETSKSKRQRQHPTLRPRGRAGLNCLLLRGLQSCGSKGEPEAGRQVEGSSEESRM